MNWKKVTCYRLILCIGMTTLLFLFVMGRFELLLDIDDVGLRNILSGIYTGQPDAHTFFIYYLLAKMLSLLYLYMPDGYWYVWFLLAANYGSLVLILYRTVCRVKSHQKLVLFAELLVFAILWIRNLIMPEWTVSAGIMSATAIFWYATIPEETQKKHILGEYLIPLVLLVLAFNLRSSVAEMAIPFAMIVFLAKIYKGRWDKKNLWKKEFIFLLTCMLAVGVSILVNYLAYSSEEWKEQKKFSTYRANMIDRYGYPDYDEYEELYSENNISKEMYESIRYDYNFLMAGKGILTSDDLKELSEQAELSFYEEHPFGEWLQECFLKRWKEARGDTYRIYSIVFYAGMLVGAICAWKRKDKIKLLLIVGTIFIYEFFWIYLYYKNRMLWRVGCSLNILALAVMIAFLWDEQYVQRFILRKKTILPIIFTCSLLLGSSLSAAQRTNETEVSNAYLLQDTKRYCEQHKENVYFRHFYSFCNTITYKELIETGEERSAANFILPNGWSVILPMDSQYAPTGGKRELCSWIAEKDNIYFIIEKERAEPTCTRTENLFASRGFSCDLMLEDELNMINGKTIQIYHFICE